MTRSDLGADFPHALASRGPLSLPERTCPQLLLPALESSSLGAWKDLPQLGAEPHFSSSGPVVSTRVALPLGGHLATSGDSSGCLRMAARDAAKHPKWTEQLLMRKNHLTQKVVSDVKKPHVDHLLGSCKMGRKWPAFPPGCNCASVLRKQTGLFAGGGGGVALL